MLRQVLASVSLAVMLSGCTRVPACGPFTFTGAATDDGSKKGVDMNLQFGFNPPVCQSTCTCNLVAYVQIVRAVSLEDFTYLYPSTEKQGRATTDGWYVDRNPGKIWGYYGRNDNGTFDVLTLQPGSEIRVATLFDKPWRLNEELGQGLWWQAITVPVCLQSGSACENKLLGYYFWSWSASGSSNSNVALIHGPAWKPLEEKVDAGVVGWNAQAPGLGKNVFPAFTKLSP